MISRQRQLNMWISTHTPLARRDLQFWLRSIQHCDFYSHASCEARHDDAAPIPIPIQFLLTRLLRGATCHLPDICRNLCISTHTPLARRDMITPTLTAQYYISTHTPLARRDVVDLSIPTGYTSFLLTRLLRGATATYSIRNSRTSYIQEADSKIITKYSIKFNILHDSAIKSRRTCLSFMHHNTSACYSP